MPLAQARGNQAADLGEFTRREGAPEIHSTKILHPVLILSSGPVEGPHARC
jgi:hypothetical protein